jgi:hypothetical protein
VDDARHESKFTVREMMLRSEWDRMQNRITAQVSAPAEPVGDTPVTRTGR